MIINLIKQKRIFSVVLPEKVKGQFWITDIDEFGKKRDLISVEAIEGLWIAKSNSKASILDASNNVVPNTVIGDSSFYIVKIGSSCEHAILFSENIEKSRIQFNKIVVTKPAAFYIGRKQDNNICFINKYVSGKHAKLLFDGNSWSISDTNSTNGTFVNSFRVDSKTLRAGDVIYIMGLKIVIGDKYFAINNPNDMVKIQSQSLIKYIPQQIKLNEKNEDFIDRKKYFYRSPRFKREIIRADIKIDPPPQPQKPDSVPMALMLGPSITMGFTSMSTGFFTLNNVIVNGGEISQAMPTLVMSFGMLAGTVLWPLITKKYEKKSKIENEKKRQKKYLEYLDRIRDDIRRETKDQRDVLLTNIVPPEECANRIASRKQNLWERSYGQNDFLRLRLGMGNLPLEADIEYPQKRFSMDDDNLQNAMLSLASTPLIINNVPISISIKDNFVSGFIGKYSDTVNMIKSLILQMTALHGYDDLKIMLITDRCDMNEWNYTKFIPHFWDDEQSVRFIATDDEVKELSSYIEKNILSRIYENSDKKAIFVPYYVIISTNKEITDKCEGLKQLLKSNGNCGCSVILAAEELKDLPKETKVVVELNGDKSKVFDKDDTTGKNTPFVVDAVNENSINQLAEDIANIELDLSNSRYNLPGMVTFLEMFNVSKIEHLNSLVRWKENNPTITLQTPIGLNTSGGPFNLDLHEKFHGPHGLVAGMTGSGKSEFIITYILSMAVNYHPDEVSFILIDYKGGGLAGAFEDEENGIRLPHLAGTITNLDGAAVKRSLISIQSELRRRQAIFNEARKTSNEGTMDIYKYQQLYRDKTVTKPVPHLFIVSDEFAELKTQQPEFMEQLISAARIGRSLGVHLILATQKPNGVVDDQIWSNSKFRVCLKVQEKADSQDMIKCPDAAEISQTGRFYLQVGFNELFAMGQSAWCGAEYIPKDTIEKSVDSSIRVVDILGRTLLNVKSDNSKSIVGKKIKQVVAIVNYLSNLAKEENVSARKLWLPPISKNIYVDALEQKYNVEVDKYKLNPVVGEYDDPFNQKQNVLKVPFSNGCNCLVYGATGNGKTTFLTTLCYSLLKHHTAEEVNIYIIDFGSETLKSFEKAPQVGGVVVSADEEKCINLFKMLLDEMETRKNMFADFGGDFDSYIRNSNNGIPNIVVILNNYSGFSEQFEQFEEDFNHITRDGVKFGIYFVVTSGSTSAMRYRTAQNFKQVYTMQLNDATEYSIVVGKTNGLVPSKYKGRGLLALDQVYEFQTAYCSDCEDKIDFIRKYCDKLATKSECFARKIPMLPDIVDFRSVMKSEISLAKIPVGISKDNIIQVSYDMKTRYILPVISNDIMQVATFLGGLSEAFEYCNVDVTIIDSEKIITNNAINSKLITNRFNECICDLFNEVVKRNNSYKDAGLDLSVLSDCSEKVIIISGFAKLNELLNSDSKEKLSLIFQKGCAEYKVHFVIADNAHSISSYNYNDWYKKHINGSDGVWIGDGVADQYILKINKVTSQLYKELDNGFGYAVVRNKPVLIKLLTTSQNMEDE